MTQIMLIYLDHYMCDATRVYELWNETVTSSMLADISDNIPLNEYKRKSTNVVVSMLADISDDIPLNV